MSVTDEQLSELESLCDLASPGPWSMEHLTDDVETFAIIHRGGTVCMEQEDEPGAFDDDIRAMLAADFAFIAAARVALPVLIAEVRRRAGTVPSSPDDPVEPLAYIEFVGGPMRPVYETDGRQYVLDDDGDQVFGVWYIPQDEPIPLVVPANPVDHF